MSLLKDYIKEYKEIFNKKNVALDDDFLVFLKRVEDILLAKNFYPCLELKNALKRLNEKLLSPINIAITGQFSSGKSTFLNALLAKDILPRGIVPVTSKLNYIKYGDEFKLELSYEDGRREYHPITRIKNFTDQRIEVEDISFLTLYAPLEILKEIIFIDTPGLNSQSKADTDLSSKVLSEVDGIIWLSLIDNAGKQSEFEVLQSYFSKYQSKSLCVLNQKDKFNEEQVEKTRSYVKTKFANFFLDVIAISALDALKYRIEDKDSLINEEILKFTKKAGAILKDNFAYKNIDILSSEFELYSKNVSNILSQKLEENLRLYENSNMPLVLKFIKEKIVPKSKEIKEYSIKRDLDGVCDLLLRQNEELVKIYDELLLILENFQSFAEKEIEALKQRFFKDFKLAFLKIEDIIENIAGEIFENIVKKNRVRYFKSKKGFLKRDFIKEFEYEAYSVEFDRIYKKLFYDDELIHKMFKTYTFFLKDLKEDVNISTKKIYIDIEQNIKSWQKMYGLMTKKNPMYSDFEYENMRDFVSRAFENILKDFNEKTLFILSNINENFLSLSTCIKFNYQNATELTVSFLQKKMEDSVKSFEREPTKFSLYRPKLDDILQSLKKNFFLYELDNLLNQRYNFLTRNYNDLIDGFKEINLAKKEFVEGIKKRHIYNIEKLKDLKKEFNS